MSYQKFLQETSFVNNVQGDDKEKAEELLHSAVNELKSACNKQGYTLFDTVRPGAYGCDNMVFPQEVFRLERTNSTRSVGSLIQTIKFAFAVYAEDGEFTLVSYCDNNASEYEQNKLDKIAYEIGKSIKIHDVVGPSEHHYRIENVY